MGREGRRGGRPVRERDPISASGQDVRHGAVAGGAEQAGAGARGLQAGGAMALAQAHQPEAGAVALLRVGLGGQDGGDERGRGRAGGGGPGDQAGGGPLGMGAVGRRHVGGIG